jgi:hypothetical protein
MTTADFIGTIIAKLGFTEKITNLVFDPVTNETQFETCLTHHVFVSYKIQIDGVDYLVKDVETNMFITVKGPIAGTPTEYTIPSPFYFHGTPLQASGELALQTRWRKKLPFWYLIEPFNERRDDGPGAKIARIPTMKMLILFPQGPDKNLVDEQYKELIEPAENAVEDFRHALRTHPNIAKVSELHEFSVRARVNWGVWVSERSKPRKSREDNIKKMLDEYVTGMEIDIQIPLKKEICTAADFCK